MLTPKQVREIRERVKTIKSITISCDVLDLLADRAEIAQELERIRDRDVIQQGDLHAADVALTALIERIK